jgi:2-keto-3-deoxy-L-rhamnonate aldolase RhmA
MNTMTRISQFRNRVRTGEFTLGTFVKTPHPAVFEVLGASTLDCLCIDAEHAPFGRGELDVAILAARSLDMPTLVRVPDATPSQCLNALDLGATGVIVPHVVSAAAAMAAVAACRYGPRGRGYAGSTRAAGYGTRTLTENLSRADREVTLVAQIEDADALEEIDAIAAIEGIDALFVGRMDLTVSLGAGSPDDPVVRVAVERICAAASRAGRAFGMFTPTVAESRHYAAQGASLFLLQSDQSWLQQGARQLRDAFSVG